MDHEFKKFRRQLGRTAKYDPVSTATLAKSGMLYFNRYFTEKYKLAEKDYVCVLYSKLTNTLALELVDESEDGAISFYPIRYKENKTRNSCINLSGLHKTFNLINESQKARRVTFESEENMILIHDIRH